MSWHFQPRNNTSLLPQVYHHWQRHKYKFTAHSLRPLIFATFLTVHTYTSAILSRKPVQVQLIVSAPLKKLTLPTPVSSSAHQGQLRNIIGTHCAKSTLPLLSNSGRSPSRKLQLPRTSNPPFAGPINPTTITITTASSPHLSSPAASIFKHTAYICALAAISTKPIS